MVSARPLGIHLGSVSASTPVWECSPRETGTLWSAQRLGLQVVGRQANRYASWQDPVLSLLEDSEGSIWAARSRLPPGGCGNKSGEASSVKEPHGAFSVGVLGVQRTAREIWVGVVEPGCGAENRSFEFTGTRSLGVQAMVETENRRVLILHGGAVKRLVMGEGRDGDPFPKNVPAGQGKTAARRAGGLWIGTSGGGVSAREGPMVSASRRSFRRSRWALIEDREVTICVLPCGLEPVSRCCRRQIFHTPRFVDCLSHRTLGARMEGVGGRPSIPDRGTTQFKGTASARTRAGALGKLRKLEGPDHGCRIFK